MKMKEHTENREGGKGKPIEYGGFIYADELARLVDVAEQLINNPECKAPMTVLKNAVMFYREHGIK